MTIPAPLSRFDAEQFRREIAGLADKDTAGVGQLSDYKTHAAQLVCVLADCYNRDELDSLKLWDRISTAIATACAKVDDGDLDRFVCLCLETVKADHGRVAANESATYYFAEITERDESWRLGFARYLKTHSYAAIIHGRRMWQELKGERAERRAEKAGAA